MHLKTCVVLTATWCASVQALDCNICGEGNKMAEPKGIVTLITPDGETRKQNCDYWQKNDLLDESFCESGEIVQYTLNPCKCMAPNGTLLLDLQPGNSTVAPTLARDDFEEEGPDFEEESDIRKEVDNGDGDGLEDTDRNGDDKNEEGEDLLDQAWDDAQTFAKSEVGKQAILVLLILFAVGLSICCLGCLVRRQCRRSKQGQDVNGLTFDPEYTEPAVYT